MPIKQSIIVHGNMWEAIDGEEGATGPVFLLRNTAEWWLATYKAIRMSQVKRGHRAEADV